jgi:hypothetical protein
MVVAAVMWEALFAASALVGAAAVDLKAHLRTILLD